MVGPWLRRVKVISYKWCSRNTRKSGQWPPLDLSRRYVLWPTVSFRLLLVWIKWKSWIIIITTGIRVATGSIFFVNCVVWERRRHHVIDDIRFDCGYKFWHNQTPLSDWDIYAFQKDRNLYVSSLNEELVFTRLWTWCIIYFIQYLLFHGEIFTSSLCYPGFANPKTTFWEIFMRFLGKLSHFLPRDLILLALPTFQTGLQW